MSARPTYDEAKYFLEEGSARREALRGELDAAARRLREREEIRETLSLSDQELAARIHALGFDGDSARVFDILPLIHVAWSDGKIQRQERALIFSILEQRGIEPESRASVLVEALLESRPSETFMGESLAVLQALLKSSEEGETVVDLCQRVAESSGGLLGLGARTSEAEQALIARVADALGAPSGFAERFRR